MKKLLSLLLVLALMLSLPVAAMAEPTKLLSWVTVHRVIEKNAISGSFYQIGHMDLDIWVPNLLSPQKDIPEDCFCVFANKDKSASVSVRRLSLDKDIELTDLEEQVVKQGASSGGIYWINGYNALVYQTKANDTLSVVILVSEGGAVQFDFTPYSSESFNPYIALVMSSIQPHTITVEDMALMFDADLDTMWGENREVRYTDNKDGKSITVYMWDEGVTSETIKTMNNWEAMRQDKIDFYNTYVGALDVFGMRDVSMTLMYISPEEDLSFLTIRDGEIVYDVFEDAA